MRWRYACGVRVSVMILMSALVLAGSACRRRAARPVPAQAPDWLQRVAYEQVVAAAPGSQPLGPAHQGVARYEDARQKYSVDFTQGRCYLISAVADRSTAREIYVNLWNPRGRRVAKDKNGTPYMVLEHCAKESGRYTFELKVTEGWGHFLALVYQQPVGAPPAGAHSKPPPPPPAAPSPTTPNPAPQAQPASGGAKDALAAQVDQHAAVVAPGGRRIGAHYSGAGGSSDWYPTLESGKCYHFVAAAQPPGTMLKLSLSASNGQQVVAQDAKKSPASLKHCPRQGAMFHFRVETSASKARYKAGVFTTAR